MQVLWTDSLVSYKYRYIVGLGIKIIQYRVKFGLIDLLTINY